MPAEALRGHAGRALAGRAGRGAGAPGRREAAAVAAMRGQERPRMVDDQAWTGDGAGALAGMPSGSRR